ncbi:FKBP-type peptidyl-prolyl cis-trans isomerase [Labilibaculum euxinus]
MKYSLLALCFAFLVSCSGSDDEKDYRAENEEEIAAYVLANNLTAEKTASGLYYVIEEEGTGAAITSTSNVTVTYKGYYANGTVFDDSKGNLVSFNLQGVIPGWTEGLTHFKEGGKGMLLIPAHLGYGSKDYNGIPGGSVLIFEFEVYTPEMIAAKNDEDILAYLEANSISATKSDSGLYYTIKEEGTGAQPTGTSNVTVAYKGYFLSGSVFDESSSAGVSFGLDEVIKGWKEGITYFKEGGKGKLFVPASLAYGSYNYSKIPGGSVLIFDIHLISVN